MTFEIVYHNDEDQSMFHYTVKPGLEMKLLEERHSDEVFKLVDENRKVLREWLPWVDGTKSSADTTGFIKVCLLAFSQNKMVQTGVWKDGQLAGVASLQSIQMASRKCSVGYWLGEKFTGKGIMTDATRILISYGFDELKLNRIAIKCATKNLKSRGIPERLGLKYEGCLRDDGWLNDHFVDHEVYSVLAREWKS
jgi:ribosomal-protein-serine acetyltransferase